MPKFVGQKKSAFSNFRKRSATTACTAQICQLFVPKSAKYPLIIN